MKTSPSPPERARRIRDLFEEVVALTPAARTARLAEVGREDPGLRAEIESLLRAYGMADEVLRRLERPGMPPPATSRPADPLVGRTVSHYHVLERLGSGGMGIVYKALDTKLDRLIALKFLPPELTRDAAAKERFIHEAKTASALDHPNICTIHDIDETEEGQLFIAMTCYEGETLKQKITGGPLPVRDALDYAIQIALGLEKAHAAGIVHRDIKPANLMVSADHVVKLLDFGIAKVAGISLTKAGVPQGTVTYMSPEQVQGRAVDHRTDLWALGTVLYEMLTGEQPFRGEHPQAVIYSILNETPQPIPEARAEVPEALAQIVETLLQKGPDARYQTAEELLGDLRPLREQGQAIPPETGGTFTPSSRPRRVMRYSSVAALVLVLAALGLFMGRQRLGAASDVPPVPLETRRSIAVLPLENRSGAEEQAYFAEGMTDELTAMLTRIEGLRVVPRESVMRYQQAGRRSPELARQLQVDYFVDGSVLWAGEQVRITVNLIDPAAEAALWGRSFVGAQRDVLALQQEAARAIVQEVEVKLTLEDEARLGPAREVNPKAYELYRQGRHVHGRPGEPLAARIQKAKPYFEQAIAIDPTYAAAYAWLGHEYFALGLYKVLSWEEAMPQAERHLARALELDKTSDEAYTLKGHLLQITGDWAAAEEAFRHAIELNPGDPNHYCHLGLLLIRTGRLEEAKEFGAYALDLNPVSYYAYQVNVQAHIYSRQYDEAIEQSRKVLQLYPEHWAGYWGLGLAYLGKGLHEAALEVLEEAVAVNSSLLAPLGYAYAMLGRRDEAHEIVETLKARGLRGDLDNMYVSRIHIALGERETALDWLEQFGQADYYRVDPAFNPLRAEPRFQALLKKMRLDG